MIFRPQSNMITFTVDESKYTFLPTGDIFEFSNGPFLINQFQGNSMDGSANNIYLRVHTAQGIESYPLLGIRSRSKLLYNHERLIYQGRIEAIDYRVTFSPAADGIWFWHIQLSGNGETVDVIYGQDLGVAEKGGVLSNELYMSQYLDHSIWEGPNGYAACSRQNQPQGTAFPICSKVCFKPKPSAIQRMARSFSACLIKPWMFLKYWKADFRTKMFNMSWPIPVCKQSK